ncbi:hypothetical protein [Thermomonospora catenispora]|uniref:hypothetical protein n=1 Tax=Thermomonospora catenispora TaxID=2493090 RepID=UPI001122373C|nr:hypothetical protein [Thermomonospora catenispora]TNY36481.1 hypothetical protein EIO00_13150 [Thermomonospora catenispora]
MQAISVRQPWAFAIARGVKTVYNHPRPIAYRGPLLIHASMRVDLGSCDSPLIRSAGWDPRDPLATLGAVIALAELSEVCEEATRGRDCDCGPWAEPSACHWRLTNVRALPRPIVALGRMEPWQPRPSLVEEVHQMLATTAAEHGR